MYIYFHIYLIHYNFKIIFNIKETFLFIPKYEWDLLN